MAASSTSHPAKVAAIMSRPAKPEVAGTVPELLAWLQLHGYRVIVDSETAKYANGQQQMPRAQMASQPLDLVVVLGGDGTLLSAVRATAATLIKVADRYGHGVLDPAEYRQLAAVYGTSAAEAERAFGRLDVDHNGVLDTAELSRGISQFFAA